MAQRFIVSLQNKIAPWFTVASIFKVFSPTKRINILSAACIFSLYHSIPSAHLVCSCSGCQNDPVDMPEYRKAFAKRMAMAGLKPHHRIALGVSGGPDSMALCILAAGWKTDGLCASTKETSEFIDGLLAIVVDHGLRMESGDESSLVCHRVSDMGIRCEIAQCEWPFGRPKQGHLQEAARDMRYQKFQNVCIQHQIGILLIAHHADDQAELFILRLSRNSGVLGLAGMPFTSQLFAKYPIIGTETSTSPSILLVRPLLEFSKEDMYMICKEGNQDYVEDPTNQSTLFTRNRIRLSLKNLSSSIFHYELQAAIVACQRTRMHVDQICCSLVNEAVTIMPLGYAVIELEILNPLNMKDIYLSKFVALVLQFVSQRERPVRGSALKLLLDYIRTFPCKNSFTAAGCYLCPAPGSKGTKVLVCCSVDCSLPLKMVLFDTLSHGKNFFVQSEVEQNIVLGKLYPDLSDPGTSDVHFLGTSSTESVLIEANRLNIISDSTLGKILSLQQDEAKLFRSKTENLSDLESKKVVKPTATALNNVLHPGELGYFMNRFLISWELRKKCCGDRYSVTGSCDKDLKVETWHYHCISCLVGHDMVAEVRPMIDADWLYLAELSTCQKMEISLQRKVISVKETEKGTQKINTCSDYIRLSAQKALVALKSIPVAARRGLPVLVNNQGLLLGIPSIGFQHCPCLIVSAMFNPRIPLGGGHSSFI